MLPADQRLDAGDRDACGRRPWAGSAPRATGCRWAVRSSSRLRSRCWPCMDVVGRQRRGRIPDRSPSPGTWRCRRGAAGWRPRRPGRGNSEMPTLALTRTVTPSSENGGSSTSRMPRRPAPRRRTVGIERAARRTRRRPAGPARRCCVDTFLLQPRGDEPQQRVAGVVPEAVVDLLEPVQVEQQQRARGPARGSAAAARGRRRQRRLPSPVSSSVRAS